MSTAGGSHNNHNNLIVSGGGGPQQGSTGSSSAVLSNDDPEKLLNEWLGELKTIIGDLDTKVAATSAAATITSSTATITGSPNNSSSVVQSRNRKNRSSEFNRFSMANLEDTHETELDAILGELSLLEMDKTKGINSVTMNNRNGQRIMSPPAAATTPVTTVDPSPPVVQTHNHHHHRSNSIVSTSATSTISSLSTDVPSTAGGYAESSSGVSSTREPRTESPDNDSAFSDTVSLLSTDTSSTSSGLTNGQFHNKTTALLPGSHLLRAGGLNLQEFDNQKAAKIHLALQKLEQASVRRLFVKAFTADGASKSLLVDETMSSGHVTRLLADKNHVHMDPRWALVEQLPEIQMERLYEDHELLVDKLMMWDRDSKNRILFVERQEKVMLFMRPEKYLAELGMTAQPKDMDECNRNYILEDFFNSPNNNHNQMPMEGGLYLRADSKKGWKRHHFVLRGSGLYYYPKEKKSPRDLVCLGLFNDCEVYKGFGWKKKHKAPTDHTFLLHASHELANSKTTKPLKIMCADDAETLERWVLAIRVAKYGKQLWQSYKALKEDLARDDFDEMATRRSSSINSFANGLVGEVKNGNSSIGSSNNICIGSSNNSNSGMAINGRPLSRASSSSSSGCLSDENNGFDSEFTTGTIKRKPSMKPNIPLTSMTRQLKEVGENREEASPIGSPERGGTLTRNRVANQPPASHMRQRSIDSSGSGSGSGCSTLKRRVPMMATSVATLDGKKELLMEEKLTMASPTSPMLMTMTSPMKSMPSCMTDSVFSLPPPPPPEDESIMMNLNVPMPIDLGSTMSLDSLPPPPSTNELEESLLESSFESATEDIYSSGTIMTGTLTRANIQLPVNGLPANVSHLITPPVSMPTQPIYVPLSPTTIYAPPSTIYAQPKESCLKKESIYATKAELRKAAVVSSPVTLRKKVCFEDQVIMGQTQALMQVQIASPTKRLTTLSSTSSNSIYGSLPPKPPPRSEGTRLSTAGGGQGQQPTGASSNNEFLKDLQRVMRKKWQVAQKCKAEPETNPHEVLGFRDFEEWQKQNQLPYYRQSANVSNWVQEHYGPDSLYENLGDMQDGQVQAPIVMGGGGGGGMGLVAGNAAPVIPANKKRPPPPVPPKRSETTQLSNNQSPVHQVINGGGGDSGRATPNGSSS